MKMMDGESPNQPYANSDEHLWDELNWVDELIRAQTVYWQMTLGQHKPQQLWGMLSVTDEEINAYLNSPFAGVDRFANEVPAPIAAHWQTARQIREAIRKRLAQTRGVRLRCEEIRALFELNEFECAVVLACLLPELDGRYRRLFGYLQDDATRTRPTIELLLQMLQPLFSHVGDARGRFENNGHLLPDRLIAVGEREQGARNAQMLSAEPVQLDSRIVAYLLGNDRMDRRLQAVMTDEVPAASWDQVVAEADAVERLRALAAWRNQPQNHTASLTLLCYGPYGGSQWMAARALCTATQLPLLRVDVAKALRAPEGWEAIVDLAFREARLRAAALYWANCGVLLQPDSADPQNQRMQPQRWDHLISAAEAFEGVTLLESDVAWDAAGRFKGKLFLRFDFPPPTYPIRQQLWRMHLPQPRELAPDVPDREALADILANSFQLTEDQVLDAIATARSLALRRDMRQPLLCTDDLYDGCRRHSSHKLATLARQIEPRRGLTRKQLVLPPVNQRQLDELYGRLARRNQVYSDLGFEQRLSLGKGLIALFTGGSGTGKTMAAELLALENGLTLYKVDLSALVSKYVGETEKNIRAIFSAATDANAILFFDEADAVFGKRGEVKDAQDRWANIEVNYLLQQVEEYTGVVILASNLRQNMDEAFLRRIHLIVDFPFPDANARVQIYQGLFPAGMAHPDDEAVRDLAERFHVSGGNIKNIVLDATFRALTGARSTTPDMLPRHLIASVAREYQKLGKPLTKSEFGVTYFKWVLEDILVNTPEAV